MRDKVYCGRLVSDDKLEHSSGPWKKHTYVKKTQEDGYVRYWYPGGEGTKIKNYMQNGATDEELEAAEKMYKEAEEAYRKDPSDEKGPIMQNYLAHHGIKGQKWGVRRFQNLDGSLTSAGKKRYGKWKPGKKTFSSETKAVIARASNKVKPFEAKPIDEEETAKRGLLDEAENRKCISLAESIFSKATKEEPKITGDIIDSANKTGSKMYGLDYRLKQPTSLAAKIGADAKEKDLSFEEASKGIKDSVRYTVLSDTDHYTDNYNALKNELLEKGYSEVRFKNYFEKYRNGEVKHKAIQCTYRSPDGFDFEVQFHTPESQAVKELKIPLYEEIRKQGVSTESKERLEKEMQDLAERIPDPPGVYDIKHSDTLDDVVGDYLMHYGVSVDDGAPGPGSGRYPKGSGERPFQRAKNKDVKRSDLLDDYLEHWGILGMKWGVRRYQNKDGSLTSAGRKRYASGKNVGFFEARRLKKRRVEAAKKRQTTLEAKKKAEEDAQRHEAEKQEAIRSGNATQIAKFQNELSNQELRDVLARLDSKQKLSELVAKETPKKETKLDKAMKLAEKGAKYADIAEKGIKVYNTFAKVSNAFADDNNQLPIIGEKREKKAPKNEAKEAAIRSGDAKEIAKWKGKLTPEETKTAMLTLDYWDKIKEKSISSTEKERKSGMEAAAKELEAKLSTHSDEYNEAVKRARDLDLHIKEQNRAERKQRVDEAKTALKELVNPSDRTKTIREYSNAEIGSKEVIDRILKDLEKNRR